MELEADLRGFVYIVSAAQESTGDGLTFTLDDVKAELLDGSHGHHADVVVQQEVHEGLGEVLAGRQAGRLRYLALRLGGGIPTCIRMT